MDSLQRLYGDKIAIIPIDGLDRGDNATRAEAFFRKNKFIIPTVVEDTVLKTIFPHKSVPHEVWISPDGRILATTGHDEVTRENIDDALAGRLLTVKIKRDDLTFDLHKPLFVSGNGGKCDSFLYRSLLTREIPSIGSGYRQTPIVRDGKLYLRSFQATNLPAISIYMAVWNEGKAGLLVNPTRVLIDARDSVYSPWDFRDPGSRWRRVKNYCYSFDIPVEVSDSIFYRQLMLDDLNRIFNYQGRIIKKRVESIVLRPVNSRGDLLKLKAGNAEKVGLRYSDERGSILDSVVNIPFCDFINYLSRFYYSACPIYDETGLDSTRITMKINIRYKKDRACESIINYDEWRTAFRRNGIDLIVEKRDTEVLVLSIPD
ncbi:TlpA family protein disulfide reductase [Puia sp. P3]|uniref:TlpA family protein disulfide reductase n=1 Tax=Puia sp. P3 TaxID=3423952 RepID=UPI003D672EE1